MLLVQLSLVYMQFHAKLWVFLLCCVPKKNLYKCHHNKQIFYFVGWYWGGIAASEARDALSGASEGTFLVRDSSHPLFLFTLSVKTLRGPTNVRIEYDSGRFRLDSNFPARPCLLSFPSIPSLLQYYVCTSQVEKGERKVEEHHVVSKDNAVLLRLRKPLHRPQAFPTLQHLTRLTINRHTHCHTQLPLPRPLLLYLQEYPFQV